MKTNSKRLSIVDISKRKNAEKVVVLTAYTYPMARILDPHVDVLLVGDSMGMVLYGMDSTISVTLDMITAHAKAVVKGSSHACVIADMPFGTYQESPAKAFRNATRLLVESGCSGVKIEGGQEMAATAEFMVKRGIPVMGHVGLKPQHVNQHGGYRYRGREEKERAQIIADAIASEAAGCFAIVVEGVSESLAAEITERVAIPTIGIGASPACDGQVLVTEDMLGLSAGYLPKFVKPFAGLGGEIETAVKKYAEEVRQGAFPSAEFCYK